MEDIKKLEEVTVVVRVTLNEFSMNIPVCVIKGSVETVCARVNAINTFLTTELKEITAAILGQEDDVLETIDLADLYTLVEETLRERAMEVDDLLSPIIINTLKSIAGDASSFEDVITEIDLDEFAIAMTLVESYNI